MITLLLSVAAIIISKFFKSFGSSSIAKTFDNVPSGLTKLRVSANLAANALLLLCKKVFAPLSTNFKASLNPMFPAPKIIIFLPPKPLLSFKKKLLTRVSVDVIARSFALYTLILDFLILSLIVLSILTNEYLLFFDLTFFSISTKI